MPNVIDAARKDEIFDRPSPSLEPGEQALSDFGHQLKLNGPPRLLLDDRRPVADAAACDNVADLHLDDIAATQLAVDREIEHRAVAQSAMFVEEKADGPNVTRLERSFGANHCSCIPWPPLTRSEEPTSELQSL